MALRRYTPPTCTLEITGKRSPLSRWASRPVLKDLQFELSFDAPQLSEEQQVKVWGNQEQLDALYETVTTYVQEFLQQAPAGLAAEPIWGQSRAYSPPPADLEEPRVASQDQFSLMPMARAMAPQELSMPPSSVPELQPATVSAEPSKSLTVESHGIYLQPKGLLSHHLFLGTLSTPDSGPVIQLGALQLFDLASALDEYRVELLGLPTLSYPQEKGLVAYFKKPAAWGNIAALLLVTVGVATALTRYYQQQPSTSLETANSQLESAKQPQQPVAIVPPPAPQQKIAVSPTPTPTVTVPPTPAQSLPTLPPGAGTPNQTLPSLPSGAVPAQPNPLPSQPNNQTTPNTLQIPGQSSAGAGNNSQQSASLPPADAGSSRSAESPLPPIRFPDIKTPAPPDISDIQVPSPAPTLNPSVPPPTAATPPAVVLVPRGNEPPPVLPDVQLPDNPATAPVPTDSQESLAQDNAVARVAPATPSAGEPVQPENANTTVSAASQVNQAQDYFQQRWKPRPEVTQPLEYTLSLNPDGSVKEITPRGLNAQRLIEVTGMPQMNQPFVSPVQQGQEPPRIRVVFRPDGSVQTFEEPFKEGF